MNGILKTRGVGVAEHLDANWFQDAKSYSKIKGSYEN